MSALGQKQTCAAHSPMSACANSGTFRCLLDQCIHAGEQRGRYGEAQCLGGLDVNRQFELRGLLDRKVCWFGALENSINIRGRAAMQVGIIRPICDQCTLFCRYWPSEYRRKAVAQCGFNEFELDADMLVGSAGR